MPYSLRHNAFYRLGTTSAASILMVQEYSSTMMMKVAGSLQMLGRDNYTESHTRKL